MRKITKEELQDILKKPNSWVYDSKLGERADLSGADLRPIDLGRVNLSDANLIGDELTWADLECSNPEGAAFRWTCLIGADLREADLTDANLRWADLTDANLKKENK